MDSNRNKGGNFFLYPETDWPRVYNMAGMDLLIFAGRMAFRSDLHLASVHSDLSVPETCASPVDAAIIWTERQLDYVKKDLDTIKKTSMRLSTRPIPPTLPTRMRGRAGVIEYELQESERLKQIRKRKRRREREGLTQETAVMKEERETRDIMLSVRCRKRKFEEGISSADRPEARPKRSRKPNSKYDRSTFLVHNGSGDSLHSSNIVDRLRSRAGKRGH
ncbi:uncharacterized protein [Haliotis asinina]|uniref:uncharacterized protein n=1 Tax=Haliotis asinina TaxID=109174 RepID=UPI003532209A